MGVQIEEHSGDTNDSGEPKRQYTEVRNEAREERGGRAPSKNKNMVAKKPRKNLV